MGFNQTGSRVCRFGPTGCRYPAQELSEYDTMVLHVFTLCRNQWRFTALGMGGAARVGLSTTDVKAAAESCGITVDDWFLFKIDLCVDVVLEYDMKKREQKKR